MKKRLTKIKKRVEWDSNHRPGALRVMAAYTFVFYALLSMNGELYRLAKINFVFLKDTSFISSKSRFDQCTHCRVNSVPKTEDGQTAFQLYIVDKHPL